MAREILVDRVNFRCFPVPFVCGTRYNNRFHRLAGVWFGTTFVLVVGEFISGCTRQHNVENHDEHDNGQRNRTTHHAPRTKMKEGNRKATKIERNCEISRDKLTAKPNNQPAGWQRDKLVWSLDQVTAIWSIDNQAALVGCKKWRTKWA